MNKILLHCCCGPCATYTVNRLREEGFEVTTFWYNPNIHPFTEHRSRLEAMNTLARTLELPLIVAEGYDIIDYFRVVTGHEGERCGDCFQLRLSKTADVAQEKGFSAFTTTLLISPYQKHELLRAVGEAEAEEHGVEFYYEDFRAGFRESHQLSRELNLYHQKYCGCVYSEWERYSKVDIARILEGDEK
jgi:predicted adenine nucleotide alpha hydrolase (AANH) superfamily ATPase